MHYVIFQGEAVVLSAYESKKVAYIEKNNKLEITFDVKSKEFELGNVTVITDSEYVEKVYNYMIETNNAYFTNGIEGLCVIKFEKNK
jgi:general stress protein 26